MLLCTYFMSWLHFGLYKKIKNWNGLKLFCQKMTEKPNTMAVSKTKKDKTQPNRCKKRPFQNKTNFPLKSKLPPISSSMFLLIYMSHTKMYQILVKCWNIFFLLCCRSRVNGSSSGDRRNSVVWSWEEYWSHIFPYKSLQCFIICI